jgi:hypothetical protein
MLCSIHQPQYLPWLGYFEKMARADVFVLLDNVQFKKNEWQNRNKIRSSNEQGWQWLTVPVLHDFGQMISEVKLNPSVGWRAQHLRALELNYSKAPHFAQYWPEIKKIYEREWTTLGELNIEVVTLLARLLGIKTKIVVASLLPIGSAKTQRLIDICKHLGANQYLAGAGCADYMDFDLIQSSGIEVLTQHYEHPKYPQVWSKGEGDFVSHLAAVDLLFNVGPDALAILSAKT